MASETSTKGPDVTETPILRILPVHDAPVGRDGEELHVKRRPGRPRKIEQGPTATDLEYHAQILAEKMRHIETDALVEAIRSRVDAKQILHFILMDLARESASLEFQRIENEKRGRDAAQISSRRIDALKKIAEIELKIRELDQERVNLSGEQAQKVMTLWVEKTMAVARDVMPPELLDVFTNRLATAVEDFETEAEEQIR